MKWSVVIALAAIIGLVVFMLVRDVTCPAGQAKTCSEARVSKLTVGLCHCEAGR